MVGTWECFLCHLEFHLFKDDMIPTLTPFTSGEVTRQSMPFEQGKKTWLFIGHIGDFTTQLYGNYNKRL